MLRAIKKQVFQFHSQFRILVFASFIDRLGGALIFPFLSLYVAQRFNVSMTEIGLLFSAWSISGMLGSMIGGALADKYGRRIILILGLIFSAGSVLLMGFVKEFTTFYWVAFVSGVFSDIGYPAQQAMVADLLQENKRAEGFSLLRVVVNLAITIGPMIGGLLAGISYLVLFILDAVASTITAGIVYFFISETKPEVDKDQKPQTIISTLKGYTQVVKDRLFLAFVLGMTIITMVYIQMYGTLSVFLYRVHEIQAQGYGYLMSLNAAMVVLLQYGITRFIKQFSPMLMMVVVCTLYGVGFLMYGFVNVFWLFALAMSIITIGEMVHVPIAQAIAAHLSPQDMRARYMAFFNLTWIIPNIFAPLMAGLVMDYFDPNWVWYLSGLLAVCAVFAFLIIYFHTKNKPGIGAPLKTSDVEVTA